MKKLELIKMTNSKTGQEEISRDTVDKNGTELTFFMVKQTSYQVVGGRAYPSVRTTTCTVPRNLGKALKLSEGCDINQLFVANDLPAMEIIRTESLEKGWDSQEPKKNPQTGEVITDANGNPIYMVDALYSVGTRVDKLIPSAKQVANAVAEASAEEGDHA